ncbi:glycosyltransferase family A protein [Glycomyces terrestris]|nr:glycosyltransferase family A protein [Glycomyces terrestris]
MPLPPSTPYLESVLPRVAAAPSGAVLANALRLRSRTGRRLLALLAHPEERDPVDAVDHTAFDRRVKSSKLHLGAYCDLAYALAAQPLDDGDQDAALAMYGRARRLLGDALPERDQIAHVRLAGLRGDLRLLRSLRRTYGRVPDAYWGAAECAALRAASPGDERRWVPAFLDFAGWDGVVLGDAGPDLLGRLRPDGVRAVEDGPLVSVVMTCFEPGPELLTAVRSVLAQSWRNLELLLVDDASGPGYADLLVECGRLDERVRLVRQRTNGGTYRARNRALGMAEGAVITGLDSDDWAHPRWIERQIAPLLADPGLVMSVAEGVRCTGGLEPAVTPELRLTETRSTSVMFRAGEIRERIGFYDTVLKSADTEFKLRVQRHFGSGRVAFLRGRYLTAVRHRAGSLSESEVAAEWVSPARAAYENAFRHWHKRTRQGRSKPFLAASPPERPFPAPRELLERGAVPDRFDLVAAADWRRVDRSRRELLDEAAAAAADGETVGLVHYPAWDALAGSAAIAPEVLAFAAEHGLLFADLERSGAHRLVAADRSLLTCLEQDYGVTGTAVPQAPPAPVEPPEPLRVRVGLLRPGTRGLLTASGTAAAAAAGTGLAAAAAGPAAALTTTATGFAAAGCVAIALTARRLRR